MAIEIREVSGAEPVLLPSSSPSGLLPLSALPSGIPSGWPSLSIAPCAEPSDSIIDVKAYWISCYEDSCRLYVENADLDSWTVTSMTIDWPQSPESGILPILLQVQQGLVNVWKYAKGTPLPGPGYVISDWETDTVDEQNINAGNRKEFVIAFKKGSFVDNDVANYIVDLTLEHETMTIEITVEQGAWSGLCYITPTFLGLPSLISRTVAMYSSFCCLRVHLLTRP